MSVIVKGMQMPKSCFNCRIYCEELNESVDGLPETILEGRIFIPGNIEKYRIPHEIASYVELKLGENMLTEEERKQANKEYEEIIQHTTLNDLESEYKEKLTEEVKKVLKGPFIFDALKDSAFHINKIDSFKVSAKDNADGEKIYFVCAEIKQDRRMLILFESENSNETKVFLEILLDEIKNEIILI